MGVAPPCAPRHSAKRRRGRRPIDRLHIAPTSAWAIARRASYVGLAFESGCAAVCEITAEEVEYCAEVAVTSRRYLHNPVVVRNIEKKALVTAITKSEIPYNYLIL
jgi:hypothetical protein